MFTFIFVFVIVCVFLGAALDLFEIKFVNWALTRDERLKEEEVK